MTFEAQNRTRDLVAALAADAQAKVYTDPFSAFGTIKLTLSRQQASEKLEVVPMAGMLTTHVLDTMHGCPAADVQIQLWRLTQTVASASC